MGAAKYKIPREAWEVRNSEKSKCPVQIQNSIGLKAAKEPILSSMSKGCLLTEFHIVWGNSPGFLRVFISLDRAYL